VGGIARQTGVLPIKGTVMTFAYHRSTPSRQKSDSERTALCGDRVSHNPDGKEDASESRGDGKIYADALTPETDAVTGLLSYHGFVTTMDQEAARTTQIRAPLSLIFLDIADFRLLNDVHGISFGDLVLRTVAELLTERGMVSGGCIGRIGPDEFAVLLPLTTPEQASERIGYIREAIERLSLRTPGGECLPIRVYMGAASYPDDADTPAAVRREAERRSRQRLPVSLVEDSPSLRLEMERTVSGFPLLDTLVSAVDAKDAYTRRHSEDVLRYAVRMARALALPLADQRALMVAALVHDIGKVALPERILRRPDALSSEDFETLKKHPSIGATLLDTLGTASDHPEEIEKARMAVRYHHERWDGSGYPSGLSAERIPLMARILAVADAYSAMTLDRPYRKALSPQEAVLRLRSGAGHQWDAACVEALFQSEPPLNRAVSQG
jgi:diguanylate cyclase (GGDEF)-like protein